ncbi:MAG: helix-turn-helix transcriptional regulator [Oscillospiraceae bacterium]|nr:helix-turn-helix transcriptional regulator [Oscillospiraceae bacterium]
MTYQQRLRDLRTERGLSQEAVAQVLNTTQQYYGKYELGKRPLPIEHLITLCKFYEVSADWLLGLKEKNN